MKLLRSNMAAGRWYWLRSDLRHLLRSLLRPREGQSYPLRREFGGWAVRPHRGWRRFRWATPPLHYTRRIPASDEDAAVDWALERMGIHS
jgi:hypothetical protein